MGSLLFIGSILGLYTGVDSLGQTRTRQFPWESSRFFEQSLELQESQTDFSRNRSTLERRLHPFKNR